jgi:hypothetical protein
LRQVGEKIDTSLEAKIMKPMVWHPEDQDQKNNAYLEKVNHAPYGVIALLILVSIVGVTFLFLLGSL